jgi:muramoyltetrapeptide carboxypeptidase
MQKPPFLKKNDLVGIAAPAGKINSENIEYAIKTLQSWDLEVICAPNLFAVHHNFSGNDQQRLDDLQQMLDHPDIKAVFCARGGYGTIRIVDRLDFSGFIKHPKWVVGFSDITVLHSHIIFNFGIPTLHGPMPNTFIKTESSSMEYLHQALFGELKSYDFAPNPYNIPGKAKGVMVGGNLSLLNNLKGTASGFDPANKILLLEDVDEYLYNIDRMLWGLSRTYDFSLLAAVVAASFSNLKDNDIPFGNSVEEIILEHFEQYGIPVVFGFPAGHDHINHPLFLGSEIKLTATSDKCTIEL